ncbi:hypothetical protein NEFER03_1153 [Nematocida sp. LUAm3]|nr:hypothetical protein NEFER03_1153 [Nematocida sp. LUAm3]KAI5175762.1 hypothetical protein NEFER02_1631 [Nematocida sp. LUAm2]KAI5178258.1 hypothetical protein NEFER01_1425 [Nematocida sp. LUAm1]
MQKKNLISIIKYACVLLLSLWAIGASSSTSINQMAEIVTELDINREERVCLIENKKSIKNLFWRPCPDERERLSKEYRAEGQIIEEKDVLYLYFIAEIHPTLNKTYYVLVDEKENRYWFAYSMDIDMLKIEYSMKKLIWIFFIEETSCFFRPKNRKVIIQQQFQRVFSGVNIVIEYIDNTQYKLLIQPSYKKAAYRLRLRKLATVWWHVLFSIFHQNHLIVYNPLVQSYSGKYELQKLLLYFLSQIMITNCSKFKRTSIVCGIFKHTKPSYTYQISSKEKELINSILAIKNADTFYKCLCHILSLDFELSLSKSLYMYTESYKYITSIRGRELKKICVPYIENPQTQFFFFYVDIDIKPNTIIPIYLPVSLSNALNINIYVNTDSTVFSPMHAYHINGNTLQKLDLSYCIFNILSSSNIEKLLKKVQYLVVRDISVNGLRNLEKHKILGSFPFINEVLEITEYSNISQRKYKLVYVKEYLCNVFPRLLVPGTIYCKKKHIILMKGTKKSSSSTYSKEEMYFDLLLSREEITDEVLGIEEQSVDQSALSNHLMLFSSLDIYSFLYENSPLCNPEASADLNTQDKQMQIFVYSRYGRFNSNYAQKVTILEQQKCIKTFFYWPFMFFLNSCLCSKCNTE